MSWCHRHPRQNCKPITSSVTPAIKRFISLLLREFISGLRHVGAADITRELASGVALWAEAEAMLDTLGGLLQPLLVLELAAIAAARAAHGDRQSIETLITAQSVPRWRSALEATSTGETVVFSPLLPGPVPPPGDRSRRSDVFLERYPYHADSWRRRVGSPTLDRWDRCNSAWGHEHGGQVRSTLPD